MCVLRGREGGGRFFSRECLCDIDFACDFLEVVSNIIVVMVCGALQKGYC